MFNTLWMFIENRIGKINYKKYMSSDFGEANMATENANGTATPVSTVKPTVGRMVYYKARGSADGKFPKVDRAAIVTDVRIEPSTQEQESSGKSQCRVAVINPEGLFFSDWLNQGQEGGQWDWMPFQKDQQARLAKEI